MIEAPWLHEFGDDPAAPLLYWMKERHAIYQRRDHGKEKPWTDDPILRAYRFCNVFRELDKVTVWVRNNIRMFWADDEHLWFMLAIARYINHPPTLEELIHSEDGWPSRPKFSPKNMTRVLDARKKRGEQIYTGAYMIRAESNPKAEWYSWSKQRYISEIVLGRLWEDRRKIRFELEDAGFHNLQSAWEMVAENKRYIGWGPFMTYEWVTDLRWTRYLDLAPDIYTWANAGPGALRGLRRLKNRDRSLTGPLPSGEQALAEMRLLLAKATTVLEARLKPPAGQFELRDIEHSLCEVDKYLRVFLGEGKPRARYEG